MAACKVAKPFPRSPSVVPFPFRFALPVQGCDVPRRVLGARKVAEGGATNCSASQVILPYDEEETKAMYAEQSQANLQPTSKCVARTGAKGAQDGDRQPGSPGYYHTCMDER